MFRREFVSGLIALATSPARAQISATNPGLVYSNGTPFSADLLRDLARSMSERAYRPPVEAPVQWSDLSYDQYTQIWFDDRHALWQNERETGLRFDLFAPGLYYPTPVDIHVVTNGVAQRLAFDWSVFNKTDNVPKLPLTPDLGYSGVRLRAELETAGIFQEFAVFQGASYFRAIGTGGIYGASARGLAINTGESDGEEFPNFRALWVEKPLPGAASFVVHALLDSPSCTGAYRFTITPGKPLEMLVSAQIFARRTLSHFGIAPLTSMFWFDDTMRSRYSDFRPAVHDSDGLLIKNGAGESIWRPLANPRRLQVSSFLDKDPRGFGLMQRARRFGDFADLEALYHRRPSVWIEPGTAWGAGTVTLIEIPTNLEIYDNIVCYWRPEEEIRAGEYHKFDYRMIWGDGSDYGQGLQVLNTAMGAGFDGDGIVIAIDFAPGPGLPSDLSNIESLIRGSAGEVSRGVIERNPETGGPRLAFKFHPGTAEVIEFRAQLRLAGQALSEVWLYRWTP